MERFLRDSVKDLKPYKAEVIPGNIKMDANENPFPWPESMRQELFSQDFEFNRYPDYQAMELRKTVAGYNEVEVDNVLVGNGSDEIIQMILNTFGGRQKALMVHPPTFGMYAAAARITSTKVFEVPLIQGETLDMEQMISQCNTNTQIKIIIICNPNNPTGTLFPEEDIIELLEKTNTIIVLDEAYSEFSGQTILPKIKDYPNLLVLRTFSKAFGMAALRLGYIMGNSELISFLNRVRQPFNVNSFSQKAGTLALKYLEEYRRQIQIIKEETQKVYSFLQEVPNVKVLPTKANFILFQPADPDGWAQKLSTKGFTVRNLGEIPVLGKSLRVSMGMPAENEAFLKAVKELL